MVPGPTYIGFVVTVTLACSFLIGHVEGWTNAVFGVQQNQINQILLFVLLVSSPEIVACVTRLMIFAFEISSALAAVKFPLHQLFLTLQASPPSTFIPIALQSQHCRIHLRHNQLHLAQLLDAIVCLGTAISILMGNS